MVLYAPAKINLGLQIKNKRKDTFHNIESVMYPIPLYDVLEIEQADRFSLSTSGYPIPGSIKTNTVYKAYHLMQSLFKIPGLRISLTKNIPPGSGLGGPSSDAAALISGINNLFKLELSIQAQQQLASKIGSDCPFFIQSEPVFVSGKGNILEKIPLCLKGLFIVLVIPPLSISTAWAYAQIQNSGSTFNLRSLPSTPHSQWNRLVINEFEAIVFRHFPLIEKIKTELARAGAFYTSLSGSGSAVYGIFERKPELQDLFADNKKWLFKI
jgi:4-diphosphocytidyl-2-C-methyl-D-erythritol kinase